MSTPTATNHGDAKQIEALVAENLSAQNEYLTALNSLLEARIRELEAKLSTIERQTILRCADACEQRGAEFRGEEQFAEAFGCDDCAAMFRKEVFFGEETQP